MEQILKKLNPWWYSNEILENDKTIERKTYLNTLKKLLKTKEILTITGLRRTGKSTLQFQLIKHLILQEKVNPKNILFFNIDALESTEKESFALKKIKEEYLKLNNPKNKIYIFLDEIQNLQNWEKWIKVEYDINQNIKFILTGSNSKLIYSQLSKLLTGRILNTQIYPLSFKEYLYFKNYTYKDLDYSKIYIYNYFLEYLQYGGFPETALEEDRDIRIMRLQEYYNSIILRDVLELNNIREAKPIIELSKYLINLNSKLFSFNKISKILNISKNTIKEYINHLQNAFFFYELDKYDYSIKKQLMSERKIYTADTGFFNAISFKFSEDKGRLLENLVFLELKRQKKEIYYHKNKQECDFVIKENLKITHAIQVTKEFENEKTKKREIEGLLEAMKIYKLKEGLILTEDTEYTIKIQNITIKVKPIWKWLLAKN